MNAPPVAPSVAAPTVPPRVDPSPAAARHTAALPPERQGQLSWMLPAAAGAIVIAGVAVWAMNRSHVEPVTPPALVTGSADAPTQVAAATPEPPPAADRDDSSAATEPSAPSTASTASTATPEPAAPARLGPPVTTVKPAVEPRTVAQADAPAPRPDLVVRANPRDAAPVPAPAPTPYLQPTAPVAVAPADVPPQGSAPINQPPPAAGPAAATTPQPGAVTPQAMPVPDTAAPVATSPGTPPAPEDSGITMKVRSALAADATLATVPIVVSTDHGVVKLEGQAPDAPTRERATVVAASATGVRGVDNRLTLPPAAVVSQAPTGNL
jgi:hypothetical protein